jgi:paraquat-inducible protein B
LSSTLAELRDGGLIENANKTLDATNIAAGSIADATTRLPEIVARIEDLLGQAESTLAGLDRNGPLTTETRATLREIRDAASAVNSLARTIERRPNSLLIGR